MQPETISDVLQLSCSWRDQCIQDRGCFRPLDRCHKDFDRCKDLACFRQTLSTHRGCQREFESRTVQDCYASCVMQLGDAAHASQATDDDEFDLNGHKTHDSGKAIDIRPLRNDGLFQPAHYGTPWNRPLTRDFLCYALRTVEFERCFFYFTYDHDRTDGKKQSIFEYIKKNETCIPDPTLRKEVLSRITTREDHNDHIHCEFAER